MSNELKDLNTIILDALPIGAVCISADCEIVYANLKAAAILDVPKKRIKSEITQSKGWRVFNSKDRPVDNLKELALGVLRSGKSIGKLRYMVRRPNGGRIPLQSTVLPLSASTDWDGLFLTMEVVRGGRADETGQIRLAETVKRAQRLESIGRLAGGVAHNLNNILSPVIGYSELALDSVATTDPLYEQLLEIHTATRRATDVVKHLLAFARRQSFKLQSTNLGKVACELENILRQSIPGYVELDLTRCAETEPVMADLTQVEEVVIALILNASEAVTHSGRIDVVTDTVTVNASNPKSPRNVPSGRYATLEVRDTGRGMSDATVGQVFEPFFTTKEVGQGSGLGLSTVYGIVKQHGGSITVESELDVGSSIRVFFPVNSDAAMRTKKIRTDTPSLVDHETVLVVEDEESLLKFTATVLKKLGYDVLAASGGTEALEIAEAHKGVIHLLLTDVIMPGLNGKEIYDALRKNHPETKILYTSGYPDDVIARYGIVDKGENLLTKPTTVDKLESKVRQVLDG